MEEEKSPSLLERREQKRWKAQERAGRLSEARLKAAADSPDPRDLVALLDHNKHEQLYPQDPYSGSEYSFDERSSSDSSDDSFDHGSDCSDGEH